MSLRRLVLKFAHPNLFCPYTSWSSKWKQTSYTRQCVRAAHATSSSRRTEKLQQSPDTSYCDVINLVIPPHELQSERTVSLEDWRLNRESYKDAKMFRAVIQELGRRNLYDAGKSYIEMIRKYEPQLLTPFNEICILRFMVLSSQAFSACVNEDDIRYILNTYRKIRKAFPLLDYFSAETLLLAMQKTSEWKISLELLEDLSVLQKPKAIVYSSIVCNALKENDLQLAWSMIDKMKEFYLCPHDECWIQWLQLCRQASLSNWNDGVGRMLEEFYSNHIQMSCSVANELTKYIEEFHPNYVVQQSVIQHSHCSECSTKLHSKFTSAEHADLKEMVEKIITHDSLYASTTPVEMQKFKKFIENCLPYDLVIDGLNTIYRQKNFSAQMLANLQHQLHYELLFLGRIHLAQRKDFRAIANICQVFLCENLSRDDVYILYSAIYHRSDVKFISYDKMRSQLYSLAEDQRRNLFLRWQHLNQGVLDRHVKFPTFLPEIHKTGDGIYHIPCVKQSSTDLTWTPAEPQYWLCIHPGQKHSTAKRSTTLIPTIVEQTLHQPDSTLQKCSTSLIPTNEEQTLYQPDSTLQVNADGTTIVDDIIKRLEESSELSVSDSSDRDESIELTRKKPIKGIIKGFQRKYRQEKGENCRQNTSTWLSDSLCQREVEDKDVVTNLKKRFKQMHAEESKKSDTQEIFPNARRKR